MTIGWTREQIAMRAARDLREGMYVNLGVGIPTLVAQYVPAEYEIILHSENGILGVGPTPIAGEENRDLINAGTGFVTLRPGGAYFSHVESFMMVRGGHIDVALLGAFEVSAVGDLANWSLDTKSDVPAIGGAMDLAVGAKAVWVLMQHCSSDGRPKIVDSCSLPLTARNVVKKIYTNLAVMEFRQDGLLVLEKISGISNEGLQECTGAALSFVESSEDCRLNV